MSSEAGPWLDDLSHAACVSVCVTDINYLSDANYRLPSVLTINVFVFGFYFKYISLHVLDSPTVSTRPRWRPCLSPFPLLLLYLVWWGVPSRHSINTCWLSSWTIERVCFYILSQVSIFVYIQQLCFETLLFEKLMSHKEITGGSYKLSEFIGTWLIPSCFVAIPPYPSVCLPGKRPMEKRSPASESFKA